MLKQGDSMYEQTTAAQGLAEIGAPALAAVSNPPATDSVANR